jgi:hypothetical protein
MTPPSAVMRRPVTPRYARASRTSVKIWPSKNNRLRRFFALRGRRRYRGSLFRRFVLVATSRKWTEARRRFRPVRRRGGERRTADALPFGRPLPRRYREAFYRKQQLRAFHGKRRESRLRRLVQTLRTGSASTTGDRSRSFFAALAQRLDRVLFRRRLRPTIVAGHQLIRHQGLSINGRLEHSPAAILRVGDTLSFLPRVLDNSVATQTPSTSSLSSPFRRILPEFETSCSPTTQPHVAIWRLLLTDLRVRLYYRRWGLYIARRRLSNSLKSTLRLFRYPVVANAFSQNRTSFVPVIDAKSASPFSISPRSSQSSTRLYKTIPSAQAASSALRIAQVRLTRAQNRFSYSQQKDFPSALTAVSKSLSPVVNRFSKFTHYLRLWSALRLRTSLLPRRPRRFFDENQARGRRSISSRLSFSGRRKRRRRLRRQINTKHDRQRKALRFQPVHRAFPSYLQRDLRTLRAVRVAVPSPEDGIYPFRASPARVLSFYRSRGF